MDDGVLNHNIQNAFDDKSVVIVMYTMHNAHKRSAYAVLDRLIEEFMML